MCAAQSALRRTRSGAHLRSSGISEQRQRITRRQSASPQEMHFLRIFRRRRLAIRESAGLRGAKGRTAGADFPGRGRAGSELPRGKNRHSMARSFMACPYYGENRTRDVRIDFSVPRITIRNTISPGLFHEPVKFCISRWHSCAEDMHLQSS